METPPNPTPRDLATIYFRVQREIASEIQGDRPNQASRLRHSIMILAGAFDRISAEGWPTGTVIQFPRPATDINILRGFGTPQEPFGVELGGVRLNPSPDDAA